MRPLTLVGQMDSPFVRRVADVETWVFGVAQVLCGTHYVAS
jgi:hypothetical protein